MKSPYGSARKFTAAVAFIAMTTCLPASSQAEEINWNDYMHSAFSIGAIAAAMSRVAHCSKKPLLIEEYKDGDDKRRLVFTCDGTEDEEGSSILQFERFKDGPWLPDRFSFAG
jgi:hypothetical protein